MFVCIHLANCVKFVKNPQMFFVYTYCSVKQFNCATGCSNNFTNFTYAQKQIR